MANTRLQARRGSAVHKLTAKEAKYGFGRLIDLARAEPVIITKHLRPVVVVVSVEEYERLTAASAVAASNLPPAKRTPRKAP
ncbi:type II toxin-antitoxin system prevent-host-death family antitoxin [Falsiroseomonas ponticola]|uniref:type II toxin-antitoxin system prevent-host-death family antitoxin n=1 Tax=Falsiroseomonas ponticola TaxID=2786951 RepID=UPI001CF791EC|nr:type II toxin-antitoxin system prevent-host-death family antitoxin [Roseomonas ponticola]